MSNLQNERWLENAKENFEEAFSQRNWDFCRAVVEDIKEAGFEKEALVLFRQLGLEQLVEKYHIKQ